MALNTAALNEAADGVTAVLAFASIHTAAPDATGSNEVTGGGYARQPVTWDPAAGGIATADGTLSFSGPANEDATHLGVWSLATGGTFYGSDALSGDVTFNAAGEYEVTSLTVTATAV